MSNKAYELEAPEVGSFDTNTHGSAITTELGMSTKLTDRTFPEPLAVTHENSLLAAIEARLTEEMLSLIRALQQFGRAAQRISVELPDSTNGAQAISLLFAGGSFETAYFLAKSLDNFSLAGDCVEYFHRLDLDIQQSFREVDLDGKRFLAIALTDKCKSRRFKQAETGN